MKNINKEYLSIKEFAEKAGISTQSVYKRLPTSLQPYVVEIDGKKMLKIQALKDVYGISDKTEFATSLQPNCNQLPTEKEIERLLTELEKKEKKIEKLEDTLEKEREDSKKERERIYNLLDQQQRLAAATIADKEKRCLELEEKLKKMEEQPEEADPEREEEKNERKSWIRRLFGL